MYSPGNFNERNQKRPIPVTGVWYSYRRVWQVSSHGIPTFVPHGDLLRSTVLKAVNGAQLGDGTEGIPGCHGDL